MRSRLVIAVLLAAGLAAPAQAHRLNEYLQAATIDLQAAGVTLDLRLTPGADVAADVIGTIDTDNDGSFSREEQLAYAQKVGGDLSLRLDDRQVPLQLVSASFAPLTGLTEGQGDIALRFAASFPATALPRVLLLENHHRTDIAAYLVNGLQPRDADLHITGQQRNYDQSRYQMQIAAGQAATIAASPPSIAAGDVVRTYAWHGLLHILTGYDHLLFLAALVVAAATFLELVKVVTAFTLAHSLTLALGALDLLRVPAYIVEPVIMASIAFVILQNIFWPKRAHGRERLVVAFLFGLFHGLGFAGGLLDLMHELPTATVLLAILGFSLGVEAGNQLVLLPLYGLTKLWRQRRQAHYSLRNATLRPPKLMTGTGGMS